MRVIFFPGFKRWRVERKKELQKRKESESSLKKKIVGLEERVLRDYIWKNIVKKKKKMK